ncbi:MAG: VWA domain-containing protein [Treponema sp.]|nr:VWA domain-containing protein [Treponema sp.]
MQITLLRKIFIVFIFVGFMPLLNATDRRAIPLDMYLIIDGSSALEQSRSEIVAWVNEHVVDRILEDGDSITIWSAGDSARIIHSATISGEAGIREVRETLGALDARGGTADFAGALRDVASRTAQTGRSRLSHTMLIAASAEGLHPALTGGAQLLRWSRSEKSARWQVLVVSPNIGGRVQQAAAAYMASQR